MNRETTEGEQIHGLSVASEVKNELAGEIQLNDLL
jgi:hypothetical protein